MYFRFSTTPLPLNSMAAFRQSFQARAQNQLASTKADPSQPFASQLTGFRVNNDDGQISFTPGENVSKEGILIDPVVVVVTSTEGPKILYL